MRPGISNEMLACAGVHHVSATEAEALCGTAKAGLWLPYRNADGSAIRDGDKDFRRTSKPASVKIRRCFETFACDKPVAAISSVTFFSPWPAAKTSLRRLTSPMARKRVATLSISFSVMAWVAAFFGMAV